MDKKSILSFSYNWNNKLDCLAFTTLRLFNPKMYWVGKRVQVILKGVDKGEAFIKDIKTFTIDKINNFIAYLDTGYSVEECQKIIKKMYPTANWETQQISLILLVKIKA